MTLKKIIHYKENKHIKNWTQSYDCYPSKYFEPKNVEELKEILKFAQFEKKRVRVFGCGNSISSIACSNDYLISLKKFNKIIEIDAINFEIKVEAGVRMDYLNKILEDNNMALTIQGSISSQTVGGVISTSNHGTGINYMNLNSYVIEVEMMLASGEIRIYSKKCISDEFPAVLCSLGSLGIILAVKFQCEEFFKLEQFQYPMKFKDFLNSYEITCKYADHLRAYWYPHTNNIMCYEASRTNKPIVSGKKENWFMRKVIGVYLLEFLYWIATFFQFLIPIINCTYSKLFSNRINYVDKCYKIFNYCSSFKFHAYEVAIPIEHTVKYLTKLKIMLNQNKNIKAHCAVNIRFVKEDDVWLSPCYKRDSCYINILMFKPYGKEVNRKGWWDLNENLAREFDGRPHWAKAHGFMKRDFIRLYPKFKEFCDLREKLDPNKLFFNKYLENIFD